MKFVMSLALLLSLTHTVNAQEFSLSETANFRTANTTDEVSAATNESRAESSESRAESSESIDNALSFLAEKKVRAIDYTCSQVQAMLQDHKALNILSGRHDWGVVHYYYPADCGTKYASPARVRTADRRSCFAGYICLRY